MKLILFSIQFLFSIHFLFSIDYSNIILEIEYQRISLSDNEKRLLDFTGIIMINPNKWPIPLHDNNGVILSDIVISQKLIINPIDRYYISHYIRNQMHYMSTIYNEKDELVPISEPFVFFDYDSYINKNAEIICNVIYHFISKKYYKIYINFPDECHSLLADNRLGAHLELLIEKLNREELLFNTNKQKIYEKVLYFNIKYFVLNIIKKWFWLILFSLIIILYKIRLFKSFPKC